MRRRRFLMAAGAGLGSGLAATLSPVWADINAPMFITAGNRPDNSTWLIGLSLTGEVCFSFPIPGRGHAAASHPERAEAVAFARRPGRFAMVLDCANGQEIRRLEAPAGRHFYGHGAFTADGQYLLTTENAYDIPDGRCGVWDASRGYARVGEFASGGIGPHEILRLPNGTFAVANGGIQTHPDFARAKLNLPTMQTSLSIVSQTGEVLSTSPLTGDMRQNSVRHIDADQKGRVIAALQWQGSPTVAAPLVASFSPSTAPELSYHPKDAGMKHYAGSIAISPDGSEFAVTGPKGNQVLFFDAGGHPTGQEILDQPSGVAKASDGLLITCKGGIALRSQGALERIPVTDDWTWDNHLVRVA